jgi:hypothetical protein
MALHQLDDVCEEQRSSIQDWIEAVKTWPEPESPLEARERELLQVRSRDVLEHIERGVHVIANGSRNMIEALQHTVPSLRVIEVTAPTEVLRARLTARKRESAQDIEQRLQRAALAMPQGMASQQVMNDMTLEIGISRLKAALLHGLQETAKLDRLLFQKICGQQLSPADYQQLLPAVIQERFHYNDVQAFLVACTHKLQEDEIVAIAQARTLLYPRISWPKPMVVDKHSMGGIPGSRDSSGRSRCAGISLVCRNPATSPTRRDRPHGTTTQSPTCAVQSDGIR